MLLKPGTLLIIKVYLTHYYLLIHYQFLISHTSFEIFVFKLIIQDACLQ